MCFSVIASHEYNCPDKHWCPWSVHRCPLGASYSFLLKVTYHTPNENMMILRSYRSLIAEITSAGMCTVNFNISVCLICIHLVTVQSWKDPSALFQTYEGTKGVLCPGFVHQQVALCTTLHKGDYILLKS